MPFFRTDSGVAEPVSDEEEDEELASSRKSINEIDDEVARSAHEEENGSQNMRYSANQVVKPKKKIHVHKQNPPREHPWYKPLFDTPTKRTAWWILLLACVVTGVTLLARSLNKLNSTEYGVQYNTHTKKLDDAAKTGGLYAGPPGFEFIKFPSTFITVDLPDDTCLSQDGLPVVFSVTFQYQMLEQWIVPAVVKYRDFDKWSDVVEAAAVSAVQHACSAFNISSFQSMRGAIQLTMENYLRQKLEGESGDGQGGVFAKAIALQLRNVELPKEYMDAVAEKQAAAEDIALAKNQRTQETTKAETKRLSALEQAVKITDTAASDANVTITEALLKANETLYSFQIEADVLVRVQSSLNLTTDGVLSYLANQLIAGVPKLHVTAGEPARLSRKESL